MGSPAHQCMVHGISNTNCLTHQVQCEGVNDGNTTGFGQAAVDEKQRQEERAREEKSNAKPHENKTRHVEEHGDCHDLKNCLIHGKSRNFI